MFVIITNWMVQNLQLAVMQVSITLPLWKPKVHYLHYKIPTLGPDTEPLLWSSHLHACFYNIFTYVSYLYILTQVSHELPNSQFKFIFTQLVQKVQTVVTHSHPVSLKQF